MKKIILILIMFILPVILLAPVSTENRLEEYMKGYRYDKLYESVLQSIRKFEGLKLTSYCCPAGYKTIGYGHLIRDYEIIQDTITKEQAEELLIKDFENSINTVINLLKYNRYKESEKTLALSHFVYNIGSGGFEKSTLLHLIKENKPIRYEMLKWIHYRDKNNKLIISNNLINARLYEISLYSNTTF
jgi:lysozyme